MNLLELFNKWFSVKKPFVFPNNWKVQDEKIDIKDAIYQEVFKDEMEIFGSAASKDWRGFAPILELQGASSDCVSFSRNNIAEIMAKAQGVSDPYGNEFNFSDLDLAVGSGTTQSGNSLKKVAEYARTTGVSLERDIPYTDNWGEKPARYNAGKKLKKYKLGGWSWVSPITKEGLKNALEFGPVQIGIGLNWTYNTADVVPKTKDYNGYHAITLTYIDADGRYYIFDHYQKKEKILASDYEILFAMSHKDLPINWKTITDDLQKLLARLMGQIIIRSDVANGGHGETYRVFENKLVKVRFDISDEQLFKMVTTVLRDKKAFIGITESDFKKLTDNLFLGGGIIEEAPEPISLMSIVIDVPIAGSDTSVVSDEVPKTNI